MSSQSATAGNSWAVSLMFGLSAIVAVVVILAILCERSWLSATQLTDSAL